MYIEYITEFFKNNFNLETSEIKQDLSCKDYFGCDFMLNSLKIKFRVAKITPKKTGQFVTLWKRNKENITEPYTINDSFDFTIIYVENDLNKGFFIFSKEKLQEKDLISSETSSGKRGFRIYPEWDFVESKQAMKTKDWQVKYFFNLQSPSKIDLERIQNILNS